MAKTFTDVVESAVAALYKKRKPELKVVVGQRPSPPPYVVVGKSGPNPPPKAPYVLPDTSKKAVQRARVEGNPPDLGNTEVEKYSGLEKNVQRAETLDSVISNTAFAADIARDQAPKLTQASRRLQSSVAAKFPKVAQAATSVAAKFPKVAQAATFLANQSPMVARTISVAGKAVGPIQPTLWMLDSARATADPKYRAESEKAVTKILESDSQPFVKQLRVGASTWARPVSTVRGMLDSVSESDTRKLNAELRGEAAQRRLKDLGESFEQKRAEADVPEVDIRKGDKQRTERVARKFFK